MACELHELRRRACHVLEAGLGHERRVREDEFGVRRRRRLAQRDAAVGELERRLLTSEVGFAVAAVVMAR